MKIGECEHTEEHKNAAGDGLTYAVCARCNQHRLYREGDNGSTVITKLGYIDEAVVMPPPGIPLDVTKDEVILVQKGWDIINGISKPGQEEKRVMRSPTFGDKRRKSYKEEGWPDEEKEVVPKVTKEKIDTAAKEKPQANLQWYRDHKKEMIEDFIVLGKEAFMEKWHVKVQLISHLKSDDLYKRAVAEGRVQAPVPQRKPRAESKKRTSAVPARVTKEKDLPAVKRDIGCLPEFPAFDSTWPMLTQIEWLQTYRALASQNRQ